MKYVNNGVGQIPYISMVAILSISLVVNLPGLAISPIMGKLQEVFPHSTELQIQLLQVLPNFVIIPFILLAGKLATQKTQMLVLGVGLAIYTLTGILYFFTNQMVQLILLGCLLGIGCGLVIPLAASLISQHFKGSARATTLGLKSGLSNVTVIFATLFVGWVAEIQWHLAFIVYMIPLIPLVLIPFMTNGYISKHFIKGKTKEKLSEQDAPDHVISAALADEGVKSQAEAVVADPVDTLSPQQLLDRENAVEKETDTVAQAADELARAAGSHAETIDDVQAIKATAQRVERAAQDVVNVADQMIAKDKEASSAHDATTQAKLEAPEPLSPVKPGSVSLSLRGKRSLVLLVALIAFYIGITYCTMAVSYNLPFTMAHYKLSTGAVGLVTALFYASASAAGFTLPFVKKLLGPKTIQISLAMMVIGLYMVAVFHHELAYCGAILIGGFGYGVMQPIIYNKTTYIAPNDAASTKYFSYLLTGNYIGIAMVPFIVDFMTNVFRAHSNPNFPFWLNGSVGVLILLLALWKYRAFVFRIQSPHLTAKPAKA